jgi:hypothetical protein
MAAMGYYNTNNNPYYNLGVTLFSSLRAPGNPALSKGQKERRIPFFGAWAQG